MRLDQRPGPQAATAPPPAPAASRRMLDLHRLKRLPDAKRALDLVLGTLLLALAAPVLMATALALAVHARRAPARAIPRAPLRAPSRAPLKEGRVFVRADVTGLHGRPFTLRSLATRRLRLDLLSRLPEVVRGRMSLVGPAPLPAGDPRTRAAWRSSVRPGLTGLAQVRRAWRMPWEESSLLDQHYVEHCCLALDLRLLVRTLPALSTPADPPGAGARRPGAASRRVRRRRGRPLLAGVLRSAGRARRSRRAAAAVPRARPGSRTARGRVTVSDADHRSRRYIAAG
ncbi:sugar transferase [Streptomyces sp. NBC_01497]|uniref:sugar transferase n=1 Tax=Streptomyces sp. NBC_01497 TaxID=2903885 RepID=UPI002E309F89|nr:sugar transferase [Streptomyces sp. NBC_01497]